MLLIGPSFILLFKALVANVTLRTTDKKIEQATFSLAVVGDGLGQGIAVHIGFVSDQVCT